MKTSEKRILFHHDLNKGYAKQPWKNIIIITAALYAFYSLYNFAISVKGGRDYLSLIIGLVLSAIWIGVGAGNYGWLGKFFLEVTEDAVNYKIPGKKLRSFSIVELKDVYIHTGYIHTGYIYFDTLDGKREVLDFPIISDEALIDFNKAIQKVKAGH